MSLGIATTKPTNKLVNSWSSKTQSYAKKLPSTLGSQNIQIDQQQALPTISGGQMAQQTIMDNPETIRGIQQPLDLYKSDGTEGIAEMGKAATNEQEIRLANRRKIAAQQQNDSINGAMSNSVDQFGNALNSGASIPGLDSEQAGYASQIYQIGKQKGFSDDDIRIAIMTALTESSLRNVNGGDLDSAGLYQQRASQGWGTRDQIMDPTYSIGKFYDTLKGTARGANPWNTAQNVQRSAFSDGSNYQANWGLANSAFSAIAQQGVTSPTKGANGSLSWINANNGKYHDFDGAFGAQCVDLYNFYMTGFVGGQSSVGQVNYAQELWQRHDNSALVQVAKNQRPQMGDIAIWGNSFNGQGGHVAIVAQDNGNGTIRVLNANATSAGPNGNTVMSNLSTGSLLGYLRPRKLMK